VAGSFEQNNEPSDSIKDVELVAGWMGKCFSGRLSRRIGSVCQSGE
jgi:hypothetical protein